MNFLKYLKLIFNKINFYRSIVYIRIWGINKFIIKTKYKFKSLKRFEIIDYNTWLKNYKINNIQPKINPLISIIICVYKIDYNIFEKAINSVLLQNYYNYELIIVDAGNKEENLIKTIDKYANNPKIKILKLKNNLGISANTNEGIKISKGDYIAFMDHDDTIMKDALLENVTYIENNNYPDALYSDEFRTDYSENKIITFLFKPNFSLEYLRTQNYICHFLLVKKSILDKIGFLDPLCDGSQDHDLILRISEITTRIIHIPKPIYNWKISYTSFSNTSVLQCIIAGKVALNNHFKRLNINANILETNVPSVFKIDYKLIELQKVSIIILNKNSYDILKKCVDSILSKTTYLNYEILIIENNSNEENIFKYYETLKKYKNIRIITINLNQFNYSKLNNLGVKKANGEILVLLNNDIEIITPNWIEEMLMYAQRDNIGAVGAKLLFYNQKIQHCGVVITKEQNIKHIFTEYNKNENGYMNRLISVHNTMAVTAACLMIKKKDYLKVGGLDENNFKVTCNDIDLCYKLIQIGKQIIINPNIVLYHYESLTRGNHLSNMKKAKIHKEELDLFFKKWDNKLVDLYHNENIKI